MNGNNVAFNCSVTVLESLKEVALAFAFVMFTFLVCGLAGALFSNSPELPPLQAGSLTGQVAGTGSFLVLIGGFVWWQVRRQMAE